MKTKIVKEKVDINLVKRVSSLTFEEYLGVKDDDNTWTMEVKTREDYKSEYNIIKKWCSDMISNGGIRTREYISKDGERFYSNNSIQGISKHVKGFLFNGS